MSHDVIDTWHKACFCMTFSFICLEKRSFLCVLPHHMVINRQNGLREVFEMSKSDFYSFFYDFMNFGRWFHLIFRNWVDHCLKSMRPHQNPKNQNSAQSSTITFSSMQNYFSVLKLVGPPSKHHFRPSYNRLGPIKGLEVLPLQQPDNPR